MVLGGMGLETGRRHLDFGVVGCQIQTKPIKKIREFRRQRGELVIMNGVL